MKTRILKIGILILLLTVFVGCKDCVDCEVDREKLTVQIDSLQSKLEDLGKMQEDYNEAKFINGLNTYESINFNQSDILESDMDRSMIEVKKYDVFGTFSIKDNKIDLFIPVTDVKLNVRSYKDISTPNINAILVVLSGTSGLETPKEPIKKVINTSIAISELKLNVTALKRDKKLKVIVLHDNTADLTAHTNFYKTCLKSKNNYTKEDCLLPKNDFIRPNEDGGDILTGG